MKRFDRDRNGRGIRYAVAVLYFVFCIRFFHAEIDATMVRGVAAVSFGPQGEVITQDFRFG